MAYIARAAVGLESYVSQYEKNKWYVIKEKKDVEYRWRLSDNSTLEVFAGIFEDKYNALKYAKNIYITLLYNMLKNQITVADGGCDSYENRLHHSDRGESLEDYLKNESYFFSTLKDSGIFNGVGVYEVENSIDDFDEYVKLNAIITSLTPNKNFNFNNIDEYTFTYTRRAQELLSNVLLADRATDMGMKMTIYCGLLENMAGNGNKDEYSINLIKRLIEEVNKSEVIDKNKKSIIGSLESMKEISSGQKCKKLIKKYAKDEYGSYTSNNIFNVAYNCRSKFSHGSNNENIDLDYEKLMYMKYIVLDVIQGYLLENQKDKT